MFLLARASFRVGEPGAEAEVTAAAEAVVLVPGTAHVEPVGVLELVSTRLPETHQSRRSPRSSYTSGLRNRPFLRLARPSDFPRLRCRYGRRLSDETVGCYTDHAAETVDGLSKHMSTASHTHHPKRMNSRPALEASAPPPRLGPTRLRPRVRRGSTYERLEAATATAPTATHCPTQFVTSHRWSKAMQSPKPIGLFSARGA